MVHPPRKNTTRMAKTLSSPLLRSRSSSSGPSLSHPHRHFRIRPLSNSPFYFPSFFLYAPLPLPFHSGSLPLPLLFLCPFPPLSLFFPCRCHALPHLVYAVSLSFLPSSFLFLPLPSLSIPSPFSFPSLPPFSSPLIYFPTFLTRHSATGNE